MVIFSLWRNVWRVSAAVDSAGDKWAVIMLESHCSNWWIFFFYHSTLEKKKKKIQRKVFGLAPPQCGTPKSQVILARRLAATISQNHFACLLWENDGLAPTRTTNPRENRQHRPGIRREVHNLTRCLSQKVWVTALHPLKLLKCGGARLIIKLS